MTRLKRLLFMIVVGAGVLICLDRKYNDINVTGLGFNSSKYHDPNSTTLSSRTSKNVISEDGATCGMLSRDAIQGLVAESERWQNITNSAHPKDNLPVYSAFWETRVAPPLVRIIGLTPYNYFNTTWCLLWYAGKNQPETTEAKIQHIGKKKAYK